MKETTSLTWIQQKLRAREIKPEDNERYLSRWCLWGTPQFDTSVQHQDQSFSAPSVRLTSQMRQFSTPVSSPHKNFSSTHKKRQSVELMFFCVELTVFLWWTDAFFVWNWRIFGTGKEWPFCVELTCWSEGDLFLRDDSYDMNSSNWDIIQFH